MFKSRKSPSIVAAVLGLASVTGLAGCATNAGTGALVGGAAGAGLGGAITGRAGGAALGAAAGAVTGAVIGSEVDRQEDRRAVEYRHVRWRFAGYDAWGRPVYERVVYRSYD